MELVAVLHNIRSVHNVGSIFRTADGAGFQKVYCTGVTPTPLDRFGHVRKDFAKVSLGAEKYIEWEHVASTARLLKKLKQEGWKIFAVEQDKKAVPFFTVIQSAAENPDPKKDRILRLRSASALDDAKVALVLGNEVRGLPPSVLKLADKILEIPMRGRKESLNVSVAFGIVAYHFASQR